MLYQYRRGSLQKIVTKFLGGPPEGDRVAQYKKALPNQVPVETADQFVTALDRAGLKDVTYHRLAYVYHCPHSLVRVPWLQPVVNEFFLRTLMHPETARAIKLSGGLWRIIRSDLVFLSAFGRQAAWVPAYR